MIHPPKKSSVFSIVCTSYDTGTFKQNGFEKLHFFAQKQFFIDTWFGHNLDVTDFGEWLYIILSLSLGLNYISL